MTAMRFTMILSFLVFVVLCVGYAHSTPERAADSEVQLYSSRHWFRANCRLKVERSGDTVFFAADSESPTRFAGFWPRVPGEIEIPSTTRLPQAFEGRARVLQETLKVTFAQVKGTLQPVSYAYLTESGSALPVACSL
jgi:hypothetical protein